MNNETPPVITCRNCGAELKPGDPAACVYHAPQTRGEA